MHVCVHGSSLQWECVYVNACVHVRSICVSGVNGCVCIQRIRVWDTRVPACVRVAQGVCVDARMCTCAHRGCTAVSVPMWGMWPLWSGALCTGASSGL